MAEEGVNIFAPFECRKLVHPSQFRRLKGLILGGCFGQLSERYFPGASRSRGLDIDITVDWPENMSQVDVMRPDLVILQPGTTWLLSPLLDHGAFKTAEQREECYQFAAAKLRLMIEDLLERCRGRKCAVLVQGFAAPFISPLGRFEYRHAPGISDCIVRLNTHIKQLLAPHPNAIFVDEELLFSNYGKTRLLDDLVNPFSHHAPIEFHAGHFPRHLSRRRTFGYPEEDEFHSCRLMVQEYLDCYVAWEGANAIKVIVCDLDNTLWHGEAADPAFSLTDEDAFQAFRFGIFGGLHQALKLCQRRGVMLCTASKNDHAVVMSKWRPLAAQCEAEEMTYILQPDDFVIHKIGWGRKSDAIREIAAQLNVRLDSILFIDDTKHEREEVMAFLPDVRTIGANLLLVRAALLTSPYLMSSSESDEAGRRTAMIKSQLERESARPTFTDEASFLAALNINMQVSRLAAGVAPPPSITSSGAAAADGNRTFDQVRDRARELFQRTNQFNTTGARYDAETIAAAAAHGAASHLWVMDIADRFGAYGLVSAIMLRIDAAARVIHVDNFVLSCRVIGLKCHVPFLCAAVTAAAKVAGLPFDTRVVARIVESDVNQPCRSVYSDAGFTQVAAGLYEGTVGSVAATLAAADAYNITVYNGLTAPEVVATVKARSAVAGAGGALPGTGGAPMAPSPQTYQSQLQHGGGPTGPTVTTTMTTAPATLSYSPRGPPPMGHAPYANGQVPFGAPGAPVPPPQYGGYAGGHPSAPAYGGQAPAGFYAGVTGNAGGYHPNY